MAKRCGVKSKNASATPLRKSPRFKTQNPNQSVSRSHREPLSSPQSDLKSAPSSAKLKRSNTGNKTKIGGKKSCAPGAFENVVEKDTVLGSGSARRRSCRLAETGTNSTAQDGVCAPKKRDCMVTKLEVEKTCSQTSVPSVSENVVEKETVLGFGSARRRFSRLAKTGTTSTAQDGVCAPKKRNCMVTRLEVQETCSRSVCDVTSDKVPVSVSVNNRKKLPRPVKVCTASMAQRRSPRLVSSDTASNNFKFEITKKSTRSSKGDKHIRLAKVCTTSMARRSPRLTSSDTTSNNLNLEITKNSTRSIKSNKHIQSVCPPNVRNNCIKEPGNNSSKGRSHRLAVLSDKLESNRAEGEIDRVSQQFPQSNYKNASNKVATLAAKPPLPPNQIRSKRIENQSVDIRSKDIKSKYVEESDSDYKSEDTPVGKKRKRKRKRKREESAETEALVEFKNVELGGDLDGWTEEQEIALRNAYFLARPSPHFWKKVSKMVPGKNAQECFNRIHSNFATPPSIPFKTRLNKGNQMHSPLKKFNLLEPNSPKARKVTKQKKTRDARKTVRHLLKKQQLMDQVQDADYFSQFEGSPVNLPSDVKLSCKDRLNSDPKIKLKPGSSENQPDPSPAVLKPVKNMELHEKYIDHLHCVDAKRKACVRACGNKGKEIDLRTKAGELKDAKTALVSEAQDYIGCFKKLQADPFGDCALSEDDEDAL